LPIRILGLGDPGAKAGGNHRGTPPRDLDDHYS
jgi:hypothetical protein